MNPAIKLVAKTALTLSAVTSVATIVGGVAMLLPPVQSRVDFRKADDLLRKGLTVAQISALVGTAIVMTGLVAREFSND